MGKRKRDGWDPCCYVLESQSIRGRTYVGKTTWLPRRIVQHNHRKSGARFTKTGRPWRVAFSVHGFRSESEALSFEWFMKRRRTSSIPGVAKGMTTGLPGRIATLFKCLEEAKGKWGDTALTIRCRVRRPRPPPPSSLVIAGHTFVFSRASCAAQQ